MTASTSKTQPPIRVGLVGIGNWALHGHVRVLSLLPQYELTAIYSQRHDSAVAAAEKFGFKHVVNSLSELVEHPEVDLVIVLTTAPQHEAAVRAAIAAKKNVYCEWPLSTRTGVSEELVQLAEEAGVKHIVGLQRRLAPHNRFVRDLIQEGYVGKLRSVRIHVSMNYFQALRPNSLRWTIPVENFSSVIAIYAGHFLDMLFAATGWPTSISALTLNHFPTVTIAETGETVPTTNPDELAMIGRIGDDVALSVQVEGGKRNGTGVQIDITGTQGDLRITNRSAFGDVGDDYHVFGSQGEREALQPLPIPASYQILPPSGLSSTVLELGEVYAAHAHAVATGEGAAPTFTDALRLHHLFDAIRRSTETGQSIAL
jgi:predicted dehydrogenase